jgi:hypothetical protein
MKGPKNHKMGNISKQSQTRDNQQSTARDICSTTPRTATSHRLQVPPYVSNCSYRSANQLKKSRHSKELEKVVRKATGFTLDDIDEATWVVSDTTARQF